jgi:hypothetical protein
MMNRMDRREPISRDAADQERFVETLVTVGWIAEWLKTPSVANVNTPVNTPLYQWRRDGRK